MDSGALESESERISKGWESIYAAAEEAAETIRREDEALGAAEPAFSSRSARNLKALAKAYDEAANQVEAKGLNGDAAGQAALQAKFDEIFPPDDPRYK